jgi:hypothetical protein
VDTLSQRTLTDWTKTGSFGASQREQTIWSGSLKIVGGSRSKTPSQRAAKSKQIERIHHAASYCSREQCQKILMSEKRPITPLLSHPVWGFRGDNLETLKSDQKNSILRPSPASTRHRTTTGPLEAPLYKGG